MLNQGWTIAHIVGMRPPGPLSWIAAGVLFGGLLAVLFGRGRMRFAGAALAVGGLVGTIDDVLVRSERPSRPNLVVRLVSPANRATDPLVVRVCGATNGHPASPTANGRYLLVHIDGVPAAEVHSPTVLLSVRRGWHRVTVEITSRDHQQFRPPIVLQRSVYVTGEGVPGANTCSQR